jgi:hypothetical protein
VFSQNPSESPRFLCCFHAKSDRFPRDFTVIPTAYSRPEPAMFHVKHRSICGFDANKALGYNAA